MNWGGIYVHIPFCRNKCLYCDFYTGGERIADWNKFEAAILNELNSRLEEIDYNPTTLYIGGGTPSIMPSINFKKLIDGINSLVGEREWREFTIEVNPEDVSDEKCKVWKQQGVNRISMGIQTLNDSELKIIGRHHNAADALKAFSILKKYFDNISIDLMFGIPCQTLESYCQTIEKIINLRPQHISSYSLMLEPGTAMTHLVEKEKLKLPSENECMNMFRATNERLENNGYKRYEISNFSLSGFESVHNSGYWSGKPYLGLGPSAHSYDGYKVRRANHNDIKGYIKQFSNEIPLKEDFFYKEEILTHEELKEEMIMTRLRTVSGLDLDDLSLKFGSQVKEILLRRSEIYLSRKLMNFDGKRISFTPSGFEISDSILPDLI